MIKVTTVAEAEIQLSYKNIFFFWETLGPFKNLEENGRAELMRVSVWTTWKHNPGSKVYMFSNTLEAAHLQHKDMDITIVRYDWRELVKETPVARNALAVRVYAKAEPRIFSDIMSLVLLYKFGGTYFDTDDVCYQPLPLSRNVIPRTYDLADIHYCGFAPPESDKDTLKSFCMEGKHRETGSHPDIPFFVRIDGWVNWHPRHSFLGELLKGQLLNGDGSVMGFGADKYCQAPPKLVLETAKKNLDKVLEGCMFGLSLLYLYDVFLSSDPGVMEQEGELIDMYARLFPDEPLTVAYFKGEEVEGAKWGLGAQYTREEAERFLEEAKRTFPCASFVWMCDKDENRELSDDSSETARMITWIYRISKETTGY